jgi:hypothetical protein
MDGPAILAATAVMISTGFATMHTAALGEKVRTFGIIFFIIPTFLSSKFKRDSPGFCAAPAVMITRCESWETDCHERKNEP